MIIRKEQTDVFSERSLSGFERRLIEHLNRCFPAECEALGLQATENVIRYGIERAAGYGINLERDVCKYIDLMFVLGHDFDQQPDLPWVSEMLKDDTCTNSSVKMERLYATAKARTSTTGPLS
jgi:hypothetical protein